MLQSVSGGSSSYYGGQSNNAGAGGSSDSSQQQQANGVGQNLAENPIGWGHYVGEAIEAQQQKVHAQEADGHLSSSAAQQIDSFDFSMQSQADSELSSNDGQPFHDGQAAALIAQVRGENSQFEHGGQSQH